jgi:hypothetical protein
VIDVIHSIADEMFRVELREDSPLRAREGVQCVIHVLGPNMNPERPNCLNGDYKTGSAFHCVVVELC